MGGIKTDTDGRTEIAGLYAAGEVACVSVHGGNRLGANSLLDTLIFGRRSGAHAAEYAQGIATPEPSRGSLADEQALIDGIVGRDRTGRRVSEIKAELGATMDAKVAVFREQASLEEALAKVKDLKEEAKTVAIDDKGTVFNQDAARRARARLHARQRRVHRRRRDRAQGEPRRAVPDRLSRTATTRSGSSTSPSRLTTTARPRSDTPRSR